MIVSKNISILYSTYIHMYHYVTNALIVQLITAS